MLGGAKNAAWIRSLLLLRLLSYQFEGPLWVSSNRSLLCHPGGWFRPQPDIATSMQVRRPPCRTTWITLGRAWMKGRNATRGSVPRIPRIEANHPQHQTTTIVQARKRAKYGTIRSGSSNVLIWNSIIWPRSPPSPSQVRGVPQLSQNARKAPGEDPYLFRSFPVNCT